MAFRRVKNKQLIGPDRYRTGTVRGKPYWNAPIVRGKARGPIVRGKEVPLDTLRQHGVTVNTRGYHGLSDKTRSAFKNTVGHILRRGHK